MLSNIDMLIYVLVIAAAVLSTRVMSFVLFPAGKKTPKIVLFLGNTLPCALMALLVVYCLKSVSVISYPHGIPEAIAADERGLWVAVSEGAVRLTLDELGT